ncbi:MAG: DUF3524 domain-containing protein [Candidatus Brocadiaceae bacterium]|jgi:glycosyltransferase involved in cell wall biosynthesis
MPLRVLALEPYYGGSHRAFLDGYRGASRHRVELLTMPARKWKWRMRGASVTMSDGVRAREGAFDVLFASDYLDLACLRALARDALRGVPAVAYFHENQVTYPLPAEEERDYQFGFTNVTSCLAADRVLFNSRYHLEDFLSGVERLLGKMPDFVPASVSERIRARSRVVPVAVDLELFDRERPRAAPRNGPLTIVWNHRWEYDKGADTFFDVVLQLHEEDREFDLAVLGESFREVPEAFREALDQLEPRLKVNGYLESRTDYARTLLEGDVVVSTALQEFFGISVVEAVYAGCLPLLPNRLSYPEILPDDVHARCLYEGPEELKARLVELTEAPQQARDAGLAEHVRRFGWDRVGPRLDAVMEEVREGGGHD